VNFLASGLGFDGNCHQALAVARVGIASCGVALPFVEYLWAGFGAGFIGKFILQIFNKLQTFKFTKVF